MSISSGSSPLGVQVQLGPCLVVRDDKGKFTTYTLNFRIGEETHTFTSRYAKLYKLHETLLKNEEFQQAFSYNPPEFPPKSWFTDYTKPKNYKKRGQKILSYFKILTQNPAVLKNKFFQKSIFLPKNLQTSMTEIAKGLRDKNYLIHKHLNSNKKNKNYNLYNQSPSSSNNVSSVSYSNNNHNTAPKNISLNADGHKKKYNQHQYHQHQHQYHGHSHHQHHQSTTNTKKDGHKKESMKKREINYNDDDQIKNILVMEEKQKKESLQTMLKKLEQETSNQLIDIMDDEEPRINVVGDADDYNELNDIYIFDVNDILPRHLLQNKNNKKMIKNENKIDMKLFEMISKRDMDEIDKIAFDIRDSLLYSCDISVD